MIVPPGTGVRAPGPGRGGRCRQAWARSRGSLRAPSAQLRLTLRRSRRRRSCPVRRSNRSASGLVFHVEPRRSAARLRSSPERLSDCGRLLVMFASEVPANHTPNPSCNRVAGCPGRWPAEASEAGRRRPAWSRAAAKRGRGLGTGRRGPRRKPQEKRGGLTRGAAPPRVGQMQGARAGARRSIAGGDMRTGEPGFTPGERGDRGVKSVRRGGRSGRGTPRPNRSAECNAWARRGSAAARGGPGGSRAAGDAGGVNGKAGPADAGPPARINGPLSAAPVEVD